MRDFSLARVVDARETKGNFLLDSPLVIKFHAGGISSKHSVELISCATLIISVCHFSQHMCDGYGHHMLEFRFIKKCLEEISRTWCCEKNFDVV
jgi:hypothetical protein